MKQMRREVEWSAWWMGMTKVMLWMDDDDGEDEEDEK